MDHQSEKTEEPNIIWGILAVIGLLAVIALTVFAVFKTADYINEPKQEDQIEFTNGWGEHFSRNPHLEIDIMNYDHVIRAVRDNRNLIPFVRQRFNDRKITYLEYRQILDEIQRQRQL